MRRELPPSPEKSLRYKIRAVMAVLAISVAFLEGCAGPKAASNGDGPPTPVRGKIVEVCDDTDGSVVSIPDSEKYAPPYLPVGACVVAWDKEKKFAYWRLNY